jgi:hypothetical protein
MTIGAAIVLIAIGAVMKWAVTAHVNGFDIQTAGTVILVVGIIARAGDALHVPAAPRPVPVRRCRRAPPPAVRPAGRLSFQRT